MRTKIVTALVAASVVYAAVSSQSYTWENVKIGGGGGFVPGIIFNPSAQGLAFARYVRYPVASDTVNQNRWQD